MKPLQLFVSCGEASGDLYAAELLRELKARHPSVSACGLAGERAEAEGLELVVRLEEISVIGLVEVVRKLPALSDAMARLCAAAESKRPDVAVLIDFSGFNLRLARRLKALGIPVVYYVSPQVWAWRRGRLRAIRETVDEMLVILPFEKSFYESEGIRARYVGHPLVDLVRATETRDELAARLELDASRPFILMMPGSRRREIELHMPILLRAVDELSRRDPELQFVMSRASTVPSELFAECLGGYADRVRVLNTSVYEALAHAAVAVVASGTATVEAALLGTPMVVVYRLGRASYLLGKRFVKLPYYSMVNLIAERELVPELIQDAMTPEGIVEHVMALRVDGCRDSGDRRDSRDRRNSMKRGLDDVRERLGGGGASGRAADAVLARFELS